MTPYLRVELKPKEEKRLLEGHPWVFANEVAKIGGKLSPGTRVDVFGSKGRFVGRGLSSPASKILVRLMTWEEGVEIDETLIADRVQKAVQTRRALMDPEETDGVRLVFGEADGLPGLVVDAFGNRAVISCHSAGLNPFLPAVVDALAGLGYGCLYERSTGESRQKEGLPDALRYWKGEEPFPWEFREGKARFRVEPATGQKTGFYLDFRRARTRLSALAAGKRILDAFCYQGAAAVQAALGGAEHVLALDSSEPALNAAAENARLNGMEGKIDFKKADSFRELKRLQAEGAVYDGIVLDPPPLAKSVHDLPAGVQAMQRLMAQAVDLLAPGGFLVAATCSHPFTWEKLEEAAKEACREAGRRFILAERLSQPVDHPVLLAVPETEYLRTMVLKEIRS